MKTVVAIFKPFRLEAVLRALAPLSPRKLHHVEVRGYGRQKGHLDAYEGSDLGIEFIPKLRLEFEVDDLFAADAMGRIAEAARTGRIGDGKIFLLSQWEEPPPGDAPVV